MRQLLGTTASNWLLILARSIDISLEHTIRISSKTLAFFKTKLINWICCSSPRKSETQNDLREYSKQQGTESNVQSSLRCMNDSNPYRKININKSIDVSNIIFNLETWYIIEVKHD